MAYRFLLEVPETLAAEANIAVSEAADAQVVVVRNSHGLGFDDAYVDLTVAAHSLRVIQTLYTWFDELGASRADIRIVLHSGDRISLESAEQSAMVAAIRRDQPWVERSIPMIGEHEEETVPASAASDERAISVRSNAAAGTAQLERTWTTVPAITDVGDARRVEIRALNHIAVRVTDLLKAERFYHEFFSMDIVARARRLPTGGLEALNGDYAWDSAARLGREADITYLRNGALILALHRMGLGARLERGVLDHVSIRVDAITFTTLKGQILMRSMEVLETAETAIAFRDPFFVTWELTLQSLPEFIS